VPVIAAQAAARPAEQAVDRLSRRQLCVLAALVAAGLTLAFLAVRQSPRGGLKVPARATEDVPAFTPPPGTPHVGPDQHVGGIVYTPHRYPAMCGGEVTALAWYGHHPLRLPHEKDTQWISRPPSEVSL